MGIINEFKTFINRGNVADMAVGIIIGASFGKIVSSFVNDVIMPPIGALLGKVDFSFLSITLREAEGAVPAVTIKYGAFINTIIDFLIVSLAVFLMVKTLNKFKAKQVEAHTEAPTPSEEVVLLGEIRDLLKEK
jgi:large conductance mechanosensitive channel